MYNNRYIVLYFIVGICLLFNYSEAVLPEFQPCEINFDDPQKVIILGVPDYQIEQSGPSFRLFSKTPINKFVFREEFLEFGLIWIGEIEEFENWNTFHDRFNLTSQGTLCRSYLNEKEHPSGDGLPLSSKQIVLDMQTTNGCNMTFRAEFFNRSAILLTEKDIPVNVNEGEAKLSVDITGWPFDDLDNLLQVRVVAFIHCNTIVAPNIYTIGPIDPNYPETTILYSNATLSNSSFAIGIQQWTVIDNEVADAHSSAPAQQFERDTVINNEGFGTYYQIHFQSFQESITWDPSLSILFFGDESLLVPTTPVSEPTGVPTVPTFFPIDAPQSIPSPPTINPSNSVQPPPSDNTGLYVGVVIGAVIVCVIIGGVIFVFTTRQRNRAAKRLSSILSSHQQRDHAASQLPPMANNTLPTQPNITMVPTNNVS